jgi:hypothetical protein
MNGFRHDSVSCVAIPDKAECRPVRGKGEAVEYDMPITAYALS